ncbi:MAG: hypothetical protein ACK4GJ_04985 [bacterium]
MLQTKISNLIQTTQKVENLLSELENLQNLNLLIESIKDFFNQYTQIENILTSIIQTKVSNHPVDHKNIEFRILENFQNVNTLYTNILSIVNNIKEVEKLKFPNKNKMINLQIESLKNQKEYIITLVQELTLLIMDVKELIENFEKS